MMSHFEGHRIYEEIEIIQLLWGACEDARTAKTTQQTRENLLWLFELIKERAYRCYK